MKEMKTLTINENKYEIVDANSRDRLDAVEVKLDEIETNGVGVGQAIENGGEIFNDYENNQARTSLSSASGEMTVAGGKGFVVQDLHCLGNLFGVQNKLGTGESVSVTYSRNLYAGNYYLSFADYIPNNMLLNVSATVTSSSGQTIVLYETDNYGATFTIPSFGSYKFTLYHESLPAGSYLNAVLYDTDVVTDFAYTSPLGSLSGRYTLDSVEGVQVGDTFSFRLGGNCDNLGTVTEIDAENKYIYTSGFHEGTSGAITNGRIWFPVLPNDSTTTRERKRNAGTVFVDAAQSAEGSETYAIGYCAHAEGNMSTAAGRWSHAEGNNTYAAYAAHSEGLKTQAIGQNSHAEGNATKTFKNNGHAEGNATEAQAENTHAEGYKTIASGLTSHSEGNITKAMGSYSHSEGDSSVAQGQASHSEGTRSKATGNHSHSEGLESEAVGYVSHSEGRLTKATGSHSHSEGYGTQANAFNSHAEGNGTIASGSESHSEGRNTIASGSASHAGGTGTIAAGSCQTAIGQYNAEDKTSFFVVGNGTSDTDRKNAFTVNRDGTATIQTSPINDMDVATKGYVDAEIATFDFIKIIDVLPETGLANKIYLVPNGTTDNQDLFDEYVWVNESFEFLGTKQFEIDLTDYYTKEEVDNRLEGYSAQIKESTNKTLIFDTQEYLNRWFNGNPNLVYYKEGNISGIYEQNSYNHWELELEEITLPAGDYILKGSNINFVAVSSVGEISPYEGLYYFSIINEEIVWVQKWVEGYLGGSSYNFDYTIQIDKGRLGSSMGSSLSPYIREDGVEVADLNAGDILLVKDSSSPDYWWDGETTQHLTPEAERIGKLANLKTNAKTSIVDAINELYDLLKL